MVFSFKIGHSKVTVIEVNEVAWNWFEVLMNTLKGYLVIFVQFWRFNGNISSVVKSLMICFNTEELQCRSQLEPGFQPFYCVSCVILEILVRCVACLFKII